MKHGICMRMWAGWLVQADRQLAAQADRPLHHRPQSEASIFQMASYNLKEFKKTEGSVPATS